MKPIKFVSVEGKGKILVFAFFLKCESMKRLLLLIFIALTICSTNTIAQDRLQHPVTSVRIASVDGKVELVYDDAISQSFTVTVLDLTGKTMFTQMHMGGDEACSSIELPVENLRKGIYMVQVIAADGKTKTLKLQRN